MTEEIEKYNHSQIIEWLKKKFEKEKIYKDLEESPEFQADVKKAKDREKEEFFIYPQLSIDLIWVRKKSERIDEDQIEKANGRTKKIFNHYTLFFAVSSKAIFEEEMKDLKRRLLFYQFYLSRISEPKRFQIIVVVPHNVDVPEQSLKFFDGNGFGLWKVNIRKEKKEEEVCHPKSLRTRMIEEFKVSVDEPKNLGETIKKIFKEENLKDLSTFKEAIKEKENAEGFAIFFEQYILDAVDAIAGVTPDKFGKRYIDRGLLNLVSNNLGKVSYGKRLVELVNEHLDENKDDYQFTSESFSSLWEENIGIPYSKFLMTFEPALLHVFAEGEEKREKIYRDHYIHQFQVFLLGIYIIDKFYDTFSKKLKKPEISWLIAASFHDIAYPVQLYNDWCEKFFKKVFNIDKSPGTLELKSNFVDQSFLSCMGYLIDSLCMFHLNKELKSNWLGEENDLIQFFYKEITTAKNHGILSSISLLKMISPLDRKDKGRIEKKIEKTLKMTFQDALQKIFVRSVLAITLHEKEIWSVLKEGRKKDKLPVILPCLKFENDPLSFLLIFCDSVQDWGRPSKFQEKEEVEERKRFYLKKFICVPEEVKITIWTPNYTKGEKFFQKKQDELRELQCFLQQTPTIKFTICLRDKDDKGEDFSMEGPSS